jgi:hypothetical protein
MPDPLHWLGVTKIHKLVSMSNMKYDAIVESGITVDVRVPIPPELVPKVRKKGNRKQDKPREGEDARARQTQHNTRGFLVMRFLIPDALSWGFPP